MVEAGSHLKPLPASILDIYKVFEHVAILSIDILNSRLTQFYPPQYWAQISGYMVTCGVNMISLHHG